MVELRELDRIQLSDDVVIVGVDGRHRRRSLCGDRFRGHIFDRLIGFLCRFGHGSTVFHRLFHRVAGQGSGVLGGLTDLIAGSGAKVGSFMSFWNSGASIFSLTIRYWASL